MEYNTIFGVIIIVSSLSLIFGLTFRCRSIIYWIAVRKKPTPRAIIKEMKNERS